MARRRSAVRWMPAACKLYRGWKNAFLKCPKDCCIIGRATTSRFLQASPNDPACPPPFTPVCPASAEVFAVTAEDSDLRTYGFSPWASLLASKAPPTFPIQKLTGFFGQWRCSGMGRPLRRCWSREGFLCAQLLRKPKRIVGASPARLRSCSCSSNDNTKAGQPSEKAAS